MAGIQKISSGIIQKGLSVDNRDKVKAAGEVFISLKETNPPQFDGGGNRINKVTGDIRVHDGKTPGGISTPPPGTVAHILTEKDPDFQDETHPASVKPKYGFKTPDGWMYCDGRLLDKDDFGALYAAIGDTWNDPNTVIPSTHFQIPDFRGYFLRCYKNQRVSGEFGIGSKRIDTITKHGHHIITGLGGAHTHQYRKWDIDLSLDPPHLPGGSKVDSVDGLNYSGTYVVQRRGNRNEEYEEQKVEELWKKNIIGGLHAWNMHYLPGEAMPPVYGANPLYKADFFTGEMNSPGVNGIQEGNMYGYEPTSSISTTAATETFIGGTHTEPVLKSGVHRKWVKADYPNSGQPIFDFEDHYARTGTSSLDPKPDYVVVGDNTSFPVDVPQQHLHEVATGFSIGTYPANTTIEMTPSNTYAQTTKTYLDPGFVQPTLIGPDEEQGFPTNIKLPTFIKY
jgi:hypothetical protein